MVRVTVARVIGLVVKGGGVRQVTDNGAIGRK